MRLFFRYLTIKEWVFSGLEIGSSVYFCNNSFYSLKLYV